jgi:hypothetical protein
MSWSVSPEGATLSQKDLVRLDREDLVRLYRAEREISSGNKNLSGSKFPEPGYRTSDGAIYAGISPETGRLMFAAPMNGLPAADPRDDWHAPTKAELNILYHSGLIASRNDDLTLLVRTGGWEEQDRAQDLARGLTPLSAKASKPPKP